MDNLSMSSRDKYGPMCSGCRFEGQRHKPCLRCSNASLREGSILRFKNFDITVERWDDEKCLVFPILKGFEATSGELQYEPLNRVICSSWVCTFRTSTIKQLSRGMINIIPTQCLRAVRRHAFGSASDEELASVNLRKGTPIMSDKDPRLSHKQEIFVQWQSAIAEEIGAQL